LKTNFPLLKGEKLVLSEAKEERVRGCDWANKIREVVPPHPLPFSPMGRRVIA
jgi:hypothetical protein